MGPTTQERRVVLKPLNQRLFLLQKIRRIHCVAINYLLMNATNGKKKNTFSSFLSFVSLIFFIMINLPISHIQSSIHGLQLSEFSPTFSEIENENVPVMILNWIAGKSVIDQNKTLLEFLIRLREFEFHPDQ